MIDTTQFMIDQPELFQHILGYVDKPETTLTVSREWHKWTVNFMGRDWLKYFKENDFLSTFTHPEPASTLALDDCRRHLMLVNKISSRVLQAARPISGGEEKILTTNGRYPKRMAEIAKWVFGQKAENLYSLFLCMGTFMPAIRGAADVLLNDPIFLDLTAIQQGEKIREWMREHQEQIIQPFPGWNFSLYLTTGHNTPLTALPEEIAYLHHLRRLEIGNHCNFKTLPPQISRLTHLTELIMHSDTGVFENFPQEISQLNCLKTLGLINNQLSHLPANMTSLQHLTKLSLAHNRFTSFPEELFQIPSLRNINLQFNQITNLPENFDRLPNLQILDVTRNALQQFPIGIINLVQRDQPPVSEEYPLHLECTLYDNPFYADDPIGGFINIRPVFVKDTILCRILCKPLVDWRNPAPDEGIFWQTIKRSLTTVALCSIVLVGICEIIARVLCLISKITASPIISLILHCRYDGFRRLREEMTFSSVFNIVGLSVSSFKLWLIEMSTTIRLIFENIFKDTLDFEEIEEHTASHLCLQTSLDDSFADLH